MLTKEYLREHPCYIVAALVLASEGNPGVAIKIYGGEKAAYDALKTAKIYGQMLQVHSHSDFPVYVSPEGEITKIPERLAGLAIFGIKSFTTLSCDRFPSQSYGDAWLETLPQEIQVKLKEKYADLTVSEDRL